MAIKGMVLRQRFFDRIARFAKREGLPIPMRTAQWITPDVKSGRARVRDPFGCGAYGCVYQTTDPRVVIKLDAGTEEAIFAMLYPVLRRKGVSMLGVVQYLGAAQLDFPTEEELKVFPKASHARYALWREAACDIGKWQERFAEVYGEDVSFAVSRVILDIDLRGSYFSAAPHALWQEQMRVFAQEGCDPSPIRDDFGIASDYAKQQADELCVSIRKYVEHLGKAAKIPPLRALAETLAGMFEQGLLIHDLHGKNLGLPCHRSPSERGQLVITDPGLFTLLKDHGEVQVPIVE